jgi:HSP20 family protein
MLCLHIFSTSCAIDKFQDVEIGRGVRTFRCKRKHLHQFSDLYFFKEHDMTVLRYEPWALRLFSSAPATAADTGAWLPPADIQEQATQFLVHLDVPGVEAQAVEVTAEHGVLTVKGRREDKRETQEGYRRVERLSGNFQRRFSLPDSADTQNIKAKVANGVLEVVIPKLAQEQPRKILVEAA